MIHLCNIAMIDVEECFVEETNETIDEEEDEQFSCEIILVGRLKTMIL
jgi:hypothetical protein